MADPLPTYLRDHLAGARFAVDLLQDLSEQKANSEVSLTAAKLLPEIDEDRVTLEAYLKRIGDDGSTIKEITAWVSQKVSRFKLKLTDPLGLFEAVEILSLASLGKMALWTTLQSLTNGQQTAARQHIAGLDLRHLILRSRDHHQQLETLRLKLAVDTLIIHQESH